METNAGGDTVLTQWFDHTRLEWHLHNADAGAATVGQPLLDRGTAGWLHLAQSQAKSIHYRRSVPSSAVRGRTRLANTPNPRGDCDDQCLFTHTCAACPDGAAGVGMELWLLRFICCGKQRATGRHTRRWRRAYAARGAPARANMNSF